MMWANYINWCTMWANYINHCHPYQIPVIISVCTYGLSSSSLHCHFIPFMKVFTQSTINKIPSSASDASSNKHLAYVTYIRHMHLVFTSSCIGHYLRWEPLAATSHQLFYINTGNSTKCPCVWHNGGGGGGGEKWQTAVVTPNNTL
jgi:hypothetical protein